MPQRGTTRLIAGRILAIAASETIDQQVAAEEDTAAGKDPPR
jgi:hypothetical protein